MTTLALLPEATIQIVSADVQKNNFRRIAVSAAKQSCNARTSAAVPIMMINVRINKANVTMMTAILRMMMMREIRYDKRPYTNTWLTKGKKIWPYCF